MATLSFEIVLSSRIKVPSRSVTYNVFIIDFLSFLQSSREKRTFFCFDCFYYTFLEEYKKVIISVFCRRAKD